MKKQRRTSRISSSPLLVGAVTTVIIVVGVFFSYNANKGLPFVPTYPVRVELPSASSLVVGNDVRIAGVRVGLIKSIQAEQNPDNGETIAVAELQLDRSVKPIPDDTTVLVRARSAVGLKYLLLTPGNSDQGLPAGGTLGLSQARPEPVDMDQYFNLFQEPVRRAIQKDLAEYGGMFAARGTDINKVIGQLPPLLKVAQPVARNFASDETDLDGFIRGLSQAAAEVAPVAQDQADMFVALDTTFSALAAVARPYIQDSITEGLETQLVTQQEAPRIRPFLYASARFMRAFLPGAEALGESAPIVSQSFDVGIPVLKSSPALYNELGPTARSLRTFGASTSVNNGIDSLIDTQQILQPLLSFVAPAQNTCNYLALVLRNAQELSSAGNDTGRWIRAVSVLPEPGPNGQGNPAAAPANGSPVPGSDNYLRYNPYPNTASPGQTRECEAGNEGVIREEGTEKNVYLDVNQLIGNYPGNQGVVTQDQSEAQKAWGQ